jgi:hypothetical protein
MNTFKYSFKRILQIVNKKQDQSLFLMGQLLTRSMDPGRFGAIRDYGFQVFSQWDEDGIIQFLIKKVPIENEIFIEFGVENYEESNTRFLLKNNDWTGLVIDGNKQNIDFIRSDNIYWQHKLDAVHGFITKENINTLISNHVKTEDIGILSIDIDGNDYWIWKAIECVKPRIVIAEFNNLYGKELAVTVPYKSDFYRTKEHYSNLYFGCSLKALILLAAEKGYFFVGCNSKCMNAFFVRKDLSSYVAEKTIEEEFRETTIRESKTTEGKLNFMSDRREQLTLLKDKYLYNLESEQLEKVDRLFLLT